MGTRWQLLSQRLLVTILLIHLCLAIAHVLAQAQFEGEGRVVTIDDGNGTVTLDHGLIPGLMPAMRMAFPVQQPDLLRGIKVGHAVRFSLQPRGPEWIIASIEPAGERPSPSLVRFPAPDFSLFTLSGETVRLSDLRGKVVLLNFWATWCVPCRTEMPAIEELYQRFKEPGLEVVAVNLDMLSTAGVEAFLKEVAVTFRIVLDPTWSTARSHGVRGVPMTYLIDRTGNIVVREMGARDWMDHASQTAVEGLLQESGAAERR
jgi:thiol-disulfide isomerase/thioredoxin